VPVNSTHPDYDANLPAWLRARDVFAGEDAIKSAAEKYLHALIVRTTRNISPTKIAPPFSTPRPAPPMVSLV